MDILTDIVYFSEHRLDHRVVSLVTHVSRCGDRFGKMVASDERVVRESRTRSTGSDADSCPHDYVVFLDIVLR